MGWPLTGELAPREALFVKLLWPLVFIHSVCLSCAVFETWYYDSTCRSEELISFRWWSGPGYGFRITSLTVAEQEIYYTVAGRFSRHSAKWLTADNNNVMNPRHFGSSPTDIRIWINPEIWIWMWIPMHWWRCALSEFNPLLNCFSFLLSLMIKSCCKIDNSSADIGQAHYCVAS